MKNVFTVLLVIGALSLNAQSQEDIFSEAFNGMFNFEIPTGPISGAMDNPPPPVPLDGGLIALLAAGGTLGYRKLKRGNS